MFVASVRKEKSPPPHYSLNATVHAFRGKFSGRSRCRINSQRFCVVVFPAQSKPRPVDFWQMTSPLMGGPPPHCNVECGRPTKTGQLQSKSIIGVSTCLPRVVSRSRVRGALYSWHGERGYQSHTHTKRAHTQSAHTLTYWRHTIFKTK